MRLFHHILCVNVGSSGGSWSGSGWSYKPRYSSSSVDYPERWQDHRHSQWFCGRTGDPFRAHGKQWNLLQTAPCTESQKVESCH